MAQANPSKEEMIREVRLPPHYGNDVLDEMREAGELCDVNIHVEKQEFLAHRQVLAGRCDYFRTQFRHQVNSDNHGRDINFTNCSAPIFASILNYIYGAVLYIMWDNVIEVLDTANMMMLINLKQECEQFLTEQQITSDNYLKLWHAAKLYNLTNLTTSLKIFCKDNISEILTCDDLMETSFEDLIEFIQEQPVLPTAQVIYVFFIKWIYHNYTARSQHFFTLMKNVSFKDMRDDFVAQIARKEKLFDNPEGKNLLLSAFVEKHGDDDSPGTSDTCTQSNKYLILTGYDNMKLPHYYKKPITRSTWSRLASPPLMFRFHGVTTNNNVMYCAGGVTPGVLGVSIPNVYRYDPHSDKWSSLPKMLTERQCPGLIIHNNSLYAICGYPGQNTAERLDLDNAQNGWSQIATLPRDMEPGLVFDCEDNIYVSDGTHYSTTMMKYNCNDNKWCEININDMNITHPYIALALMRDKPTWYKYFSSINVHSLSNHGLPALFKDHVPIDVIDNVYSACMFNEVIYCWTRTPKLWKCQLSNNRKTWQWSEIDKPDAYDSFVNIAAV